MIMMKDGDGWFCMAFRFRVEWILGDAMRVCAYSCSRAFPQYEEVGSEDDFNLI